MQSSDPKISVVLIVKNEEVMLPKCLESVKEADEIIVCDTGSTDKTIEVAKKYTPHVYDDYKWIPDTPTDSFAKARNHALSKATGDWVLSIDADEVLHSFFEVRQAVKLAEEKGVKAVNIKQFAGDSGQVNMFPRLFKKCKEVFWVGDIHNHISIQGTDVGDVRLTYGYSPAHLLDPNRTLRILERVVKTDPNAVREMFYLAREYFYRNRFEESLTLAGQYVQKSQYLAEKAECFLMMARTYWTLSMGEDARDACMQAIKINANFKEALMFMAQLSWPENGERWNQFAQLADNRNVLFVRT